MFCGVFVFFFLIIIIIIIIIIILLLLLLLLFWWTFHTKKEPLEVKMEKEDRNYQYSVLY